MLITPNLSLPYIDVNAAQREVVHNEAIRGLDALVQIAVLDRDLAAPPGSPADGERWIVAESPTGGWAGHATEIAAWQDGAWRFYAPRVGWFVFVADEDALIAWNGSAWIDALAMVTVLQNLTRLGIGTMADATNPFSAKLNNALWTALTVAEGGDGDLRYKLSKEGTADTLSLLMQTNFSGRAEIGLTGDDDLHFKVSPDGSSWFDSLTLASTSGQVRLGIDGSASAPALSFASDPDNGLYRIGANNWALSAGGTKAIDIAATTVCVAPTTASTSPTTGALTVAGGIGVAGNVYLGSSLFLPSAGVINFNAGDLTLGHSSNLLTLAGGNFSVSAGTLSVTHSAGGSGRAWSASSPTVAVIDRGGGGCYLSLVTGAAGSCRINFGDTDAESRGIVDYNHSTETLSLFTANVSRISLAGTVLSPTSNDGVALGSASQMWSDMFLASGAVINFNNGDVTCTHASNALTWAGGASGYTFSDGGLVVGSPTGGHKGDGTVNAAAVYDDNVLLTDYVFDKYLGTDLPDAYSPRVREKFDALDPRMFDIGAFAAFWREHRRLYGMPDLNECIDGAVKAYSLGAMIQKLMQVVELQAIHIGALAERIGELESRVE